MECYTVSRYCPLWIFPFGLPLKVFKTRLLGRGFHTLVKNASFSSPTDVGSHNPPRSGPSVLVGTRSLLQLMWDPPTFLLAHRLMSTPFGAQPPRWCARCLALIPFCNGPSPPLVDIVLLGLSLLGFSSRFLKLVC